MLDLLTDVVGLAERRCSYAEARHVAERREDLEVRGGAVDEASHETVEGIGVRVRVGGAWGFAATADVSRAGAETALERALAFAAAQPAGADRPLTAVEAARGSWASPCERDPFDVPLEDKLALLAEADAALRGDARIARSHARLTARRIHKHFASTEGSVLEQVTVLCGAGLQAIAVDEQDVQVRSYPTGHGGDTRAAGWEHILALDLVGNAPRVADEAIALLSAPACPEGRTTIVLHGEQLALQTHESIGHALELDRILLGEASYAGTSWVATGDFHPTHPLRYGSELLNVTADATVPGGLGTYGWDDEGVAARRTPLIEAGVLRAALSDRESAAAVGLDGAGGCARADGFARQPIVRMTNVNVEPGGGGLAPRGGVPPPADRAHDQCQRGARGRGVARRPDRRHRQRPLPRDQQVGVDRRPAAAVPVRDRDLPRDPRRRTRPALPQPVVRRDHAAVLELARRRLRRRRVAAVGADELRQGRTRADHGGLAWHVPGALPRR